jgi:protein-tyrosine phosphatase
MEAATPHGFARLALDALERKMNRSVRPVQEKAMKLRVLGGLLLLAAIVRFSLLAAGSTAVNGIENPTCELVSPGIYRLNFQASPDAGPVEVFASSWPDRIDSEKPVLTIRKPPAEVSIGEQAGRVYFHLKPASGPVRVVSIRRLPLEGARNFRDLGGYRTSDGHYVRWGLVYRSNHLVNLTAKDSRYLNSLNIRLVCDVRSDGERTRAPDRWVENPPEFFDVPIGSNLITSPTAQDLKHRVAAINSQTKESVRAYDYATDYAGQYGKILQRLAAGDLPTVEHCTAGKDRSGVFSAILLTALGVPREVVIQDYLLSNQYLLAPDAIENTAADLQRAFGLPELPDIATVRTIMTSKPETMEATLDQISKKYGSFENYLHDALHLSDSELTALRHRLVEP